MASPNRSFIGSFIAAACLAAGALILATPAAQAQYKWIGSDGSVNYSDLPPPGDHRTLLRTPGSAAAARAEQPPAGEGEVRLPYALRTAVDKYPVVLYTASDCEPCEQARAHLKQRGVPYTEKRVRTQADIKAFEALGFESAQFPSLSVGRGKMVGFEGLSWGRMLDAAGYPKSSMLPANYTARPLEDMKSGPEKALATTAGTAAASQDPATRQVARRGASGGAQAGASASTAGDGDSLLLPAAYDGPNNPIRF